MRPNIDRTISRVDAGQFGPVPYGAGTESPIFRSDLGGTDGVATMPMFTVTTDGGEGPVRSDEPLQFVDAKAVIDDAQIALVEMAREKLPNGKRAYFEVRVEDETGRVIYIAEMHFKARTEESIANTAVEIDDVASRLGDGPRD